MIANAVFSGTGVLTSWACMWSTIILDFMCGCWDAILTLFSRGRQRYQRLFHRFRWPINRLLTWLRWCCCTIIHLCRWLHWFSRRVLLPVCEEVTYTMSRLAFYFVLFLVGYVGPLVLDHIHLCLPFPPLGVWTLVHLCFSVPGLIQGCTFFCWDLSPISPSGRALCVRVVRGCVSWFRECSPVFRPGLASCVRVVRGCYFLCRECSPALPPGQASCVRVVRGCLCLAKESAPVIATIMASLSAARKFISVSAPGDAQLMRGVQECLQCVRDSVPTSHPVCDFRGCRRFLSQCVAWTGARSGYSRYYSPRVWFPEVCLSALDALLRVLSLARVSRVGASSREEFSLAQTSGFGAPFQETLFLRHSTEGVSVRRSAEGVSWSVRRSAEGVSWVALPPELVRLLFESCPGVPRAPFSMDGHSMFLRGRRPGMDLLRAGLDVFAMGNSSSRGRSLQRRFILDSGSVFTIVNDRALFDPRTLRPTLTEGVAANNGPLRFEGEGSALGLPLVYLNTDFRTSLISLADLLGDNDMRTLDKGEVIVFTNRVSGREMWRFRRDGRLYYLDASTQNVVNAVRALPAAGARVKLLHRRLMHCNYKSLKLLIDNDVVDGLRPYKSMSFPENSWDCVGCRAGKMVRLPASGSNRRRATRPGEGWHWDIIVFRVPSVLNHRYFLLFTDDYSGYLHGYPLKRKSDAFATFRKFYTDVIRGATADGIRMKWIQSDRGGEFVSLALRQLLQDVCFVSQRLVPAGAHDHKVERAIRTVVGDARAALHDQLLRLDYWPYALQYAINARNCIPRANLEQGRVSPFELIYKRRPSLHRFRVFGSPCTIYAENDNKLEERGTPGVYLGFAEIGMIVHDTVKDKIVTRKHVIVHERAPHPRGVITTADSDGSSVDGLGRFQPHLESPESDPVSDCSQYFATGDQNEDPLVEIFGDSPASVEELAMVNKLRSAITFSPEVTVQRFDVDEPANSVPRGPPLTIRSPSIGGPPPLSEDSSEVDDNVEDVVCAEPRQADDTSLEEPRITASSGDQDVVNTEPVHRLRFPTLRRQVETGLGGRYWDESHPNKTPESPTRRTLRSHALADRQRTVARISRKKELEGLLDQIVTGSQVLRVRTGDSRHPVCLANFVDVDVLDYEDDRVYAINGSNLTPTPNHWRQARLSEEVAEWLKAELDEHQGLLDNDTFDVVSKRDVPRGAKILTSRFVYADKVDENGDRVRFKARIVLRGFQQRDGIDYAETFAGTAHLTSIRTLLALAAGNRMKLWQMDITRAFTTAPLTDAILYSYPPDGLEGYEGKVWRLKKSLYGAKQAAHLFSEHLSGVLLDMGLRRCQADTSVWVMKENRGSGRVACLYVCTWVDDCIIAYSDEKIRDKFRDGIKFRDCLSMTILQDEENGSITVSQVIIIINLIAQWDDITTTNRRYAPATLPSH